jgi:hypothetical protein
LVCRHNVDLKVEVSELNRMRKKLAEYARKKCQPKSEELVFSLAC